MYPPTYPQDAKHLAFYLLYRWHMLSVKVKWALDKGLRVILKKSATSENPTSYSLVKRYEGSKVWRTPFEAESVDEVYDFDTGKFTLEHLDENRRITFLKTVTPQVEDEDDDEDYDDDFDEDEDYYDDDEEECN